MRPVLPFLLATTVPSCHAFVASRSALFRIAPTIKLHSNNNSEIATIVNGNTTNDNVTTTTTTLLQKCDTLFGLRLKPMAVAARNQANSYTYQTDPIKKLIYTTKACACIILFIFYRAQRGVFVILPAVFRSVYDTLEQSRAVDYAGLFNDADGDASNEKNDINPATGKVRWRTRITVSLLASLITLSYTISGAWRVFQKFVGAGASNFNMEKSLEVAADEVMRNEKKICDTFVVDKNADFE